MMGIWIGGRRGGRRGGRESERRRERRGARRRRAGEYIKGLSKESLNALLGFGSVVYIYLGKCESSFSRFFGLRRLNKLVVRLNL